MNYANFSSCEAHPELIFTFNLESYRESVQQVEHSVEQTQESDLLDKLYPDTTANVFKMFMAVMAPYPHGV